MSWLSNAWDFSVGVGKGVYAGGKGLVTGAVDLAKGGYAIATDPVVREQAWETTKQVAGAVGNYAGEAWEDPEMVWRDVKNGAGRARTAYDEFRSC